MKKVIKPWAIIFLLMLIALAGCQKSSDGVTNSYNPLTPDGSINGLFTINENGGKVYFSQGNLQYQASTDTWRFAEHQLDFVGSTVVEIGEPGGTIIGSSNHLISPTYNGWIDLFGWGTGNNPTNSSTNDGDYYAFNDWGSNNISNGGDNSWRTLTKNEWVFVFLSRNTPSEIRFAKAIVNDENGMILLPDNWRANYYTLNNTNKITALYSSNIISLDSWTTELEAKGAVFLPAAGHRDGTYVNVVGDCGGYWSSTYSYNTIANDELSYLALFHGYYFAPNDEHDRHSGYSVRLVCPAK